ncbi:MAG: tol-pal system protein YbgF [Zoogloeaceae bacterium]|nr:tol-pal system protein YbgF [Zoogloeaceae bacterium]
MNKLLPIAFLLSMLGFNTAHAQLFGGDDQARRQIVELRNEMTARMEASNRGQLELANQNEMLRNEVANLRGQAEVLTHELESLKQRQRDFYVDLDKRIQRLEGGAQPPGADAGTLLGTAPAPTAGASTADPAAESTEYEAALTLLKGGKHSEALAAFNRFIARHPQSGSLPNAHFWAGNAALQARDIAASRGHFNTVLQRWPQDKVAPDAMLGLANTQQALGDARGSQETLRKVISQYPNSTAAQQASQRLGQ